MTRVQDQAPGVRPDLRTARSHGGAADRGIDCRAGDLVLPAAADPLVAGVCGHAPGHRACGVHGPVAVQVRAIIRSPFPGLRGIEALTTSVPLFLLLFASSYVVMAAMSAGNFGGRVTHTDGLYFTVT